MSAPLVVLELGDGVGVADLASMVAAHEWYHRIGLGPGLVTPGVERYVPYQRPVLAALADLDLTGRRVLDVGCRDGLHDATSPSFFNRKGLRDTLASFGLVIDEWSELGEVLRYPKGRRARLLGRQRIVDRVTLVARRDDRTLDPYLEDYFWASHTTRGWI